MRLETSLGLSRRDAVRTCQWALWKAGKGKYLGDVMVSWGKIIDMRERFLSVKSGVGKLWERIKERNNNWEDLRGGRDRYGLMKYLHYVKQCREYRLSGSVVGWESLHFYFFNPHTTLEAISRTLLVALGVSSLSISEQHIPCIYQHARYMPFLWSEEIDLMPPGVSAHFT